MNTHADKTTDNKSKSVANYVSQKQGGGESTFQFVDNRPEAVAQRKLHEMASNSPQTKKAAQLKEIANNFKQEQKPIQKKDNNTGLPDNLKTGMENLSGISLDDVKVHLNSDRPAQLQAHAYAQGTNIHLGAGQEKHLPYEAWHVVQQKQGRVKPNMQMEGKVNVNDDAGLEKEADVMGQKAMSVVNRQATSVLKVNSNGNTVQRVLNDEQLAEKDSSANGIKESLIYLLEEIIKCPDPKEERGKQALEKWEQAQDLGERAKEIVEDPIGEVAKAAAKEYWDSLSNFEKAEVVGKAIMQGAKGLVTLLQNIRISLPGAGGGERQGNEDRGSVNLSFDNLGSFEINKSDLDLLYDILRARHDFNKEKAKAENEVEGGKSWLKRKVEKGIHSVGKGIGSHEAEANRAELKKINTKLIIALQRNYDELEGELEGHENVNDRYDELFALFDPLLKNLMTQPLAYINLPDLSGQERTQFKNAAVMYLALLRSARIKKPTKEIAMDMASSAKKTFSAGIKAIKDKFF